MTKISDVLLRFSLLTSVLCSGCEYGTAAVPADATGQERLSTESAAPEPVLAGMPVRKTLVRTTTQPARIEAFERAPLYARVSGYVEQVLVDIGDEVAKGQLLVQLATPELEDDRRQKQALVDQAKAERGQAQASLKAAEAGLRSAQASIEQSKAGTARAEADYERWRAESERIDSLAASGSVTQKVADETRNQFRAADAARQEVAATILVAEAAFAEAEAEVANAKADIVASEARSAVAEANLERAETMLAYAQIKAPFAGVITERNVDTGHLVSEGSVGGPLMTIVQSNQVRVFLEVPETEAAMVNTGDPARVQVQALDGLEVEGEVTRTAWILDRANRSLSTEIDLDNAEGNLRPGMYSLATIELAQRDEVLTLPVSAIARTADGEHCFILEDGKALRRSITLGLRVGEEWEIRSGLSGDETVAFAKANTLRHGQSVEPVLPQPSK